MPGLSPIAVEFGGVGYTDSMDFGNLPNVYSDKTPETISFSIWINLADLSEPGGVFVHDLINTTVDPGGIALGVQNIDTTPKIFVQSNMFDSASGSWRGTFTPEADAWHHVVMTFDIGATTNDPIVYYDGSVLATLTETATPAGTKYSRDATQVFIGNKQNPFDYGSGFNGMLFDPRIYNRILTAGEVTTLYNSGTPSVSAGYAVGSALYNKSLVFHGFAVRTGELADFVDQDLSALKVFDGQYLAVGETNGAPVGRASP